MTDLSAPPTYLFTAFGTVLYVDVATGRLRHGPVESSPANAVFVAEPGWGQSHRKGWLMQEKGDSRELIACLSDHCQAVSSMERGGNSAAGTLLELVPLERGLIAFTADGLFLTAEPGGQLSLRAPVCSTWECFLASENWCTDGAVNDLLPAIANAKFDTKRIRTYLVHPLIRKSANAKSTSTKVLIYGYPQWSHGRVYYDLCKQLHRRGYIVDILNWQIDHAAYMADLISFYDLFMTALDGVRTLTDVYGVPYDRVVALSHHEFDIRMLIEQKGVEVFDKFANYGVVSEYLYCASLMKGVPRVPKVVSLGINFAEFYSKISDRLATVGYASSMSARTYGIEWKRGELAEAAAREAGLEFSVAGSTGNQTSFHDMPEFYRSVDAVLTSSISEAAQLPIMEAAAAGRLVIGTPVGHFPRKAYEGGGILAPVEAGKFKAFTVETLRYYKDNPAAYRDKCHAIQEAARRFDWKYTIDEWVELIEAAIVNPATAPVPTGGKSPSTLNLIE
jgi:glycosyltransferase involved in cell wall biosynthesis